MTVTQRDAAISNLKASYQAMQDADPPTLVAAHRHHFKDHESTAKAIAAGDPEVLRGDLRDEIKETAYRLGIHWTLIAGDQA